MAFFTAALIASSIIGAASGISAASSQKRAAGRSSRQTLLQSEEDARRARRDTSALRGRQRAITAAQGTRESGSPLLIFEDTAREAEIEIEHILQGGTARSDVFRQQGRAAQFAGIFNAGSTILGGFAEAFR